MDAKLIAEAVEFRTAERRLLDAGLVIDASAVSPDHRRALAALRRLEETQPKPTAPLATSRRIGFGYPNAR